CGVLRALSTRGVLVCMWSGPRFLPAGVAALLLAASLPAAAQEKSRMAVVLERGKLIVVTLTAVPPFAFTDEKGQLVGFDIDIARLGATGLFQDPNKGEFVRGTAQGRWPAIESGRADLGG